MNILLCGAIGQMGKEMIRLSRSRCGFSRIALGVDLNSEINDTGIPVLSSFDEITDASGIDCIVDFSNHAIARELVRFARGNKLPCVICTTGHTEDEIADIHSLASAVPVFFSANMSLGVALLIELAKTAVLAMPGAEIEIIETHHSKKVDAPSGTALKIADALAAVRPNSSITVGRVGQGVRTPDEIGIHAVRMGNTVGVHEVIVGTPNQTIALKHEAHSRALFAEGALVAAEFIVDRDAGLYGMKSLVSGEEET